VSGLVFTALVFTALWLGSLTLVVLLLVRQIGLLTVRLDLAKRVVEPSNDGLIVGTRVPEEVMAELPELKVGLAYILLVSATCDSCRILVADLQRELPQAANLVALVPGRAELAEGLVSLLQPKIRSVRDPEATALARSLQIQSTPFVLAVEEGIVAGKAYLHRATDLVQFIVDREASAAGPSIHTIEEVTGHVR
jgi:hypothetical protein